MADMAGEDMRVPRTCGRQTFLRSNVPATTPERYYRRTTFLPFLDNLLRQLTTCFDGVTEETLRVLLLIPSNVQKLDKASQKQVQEHYAPDLPSKGGTAQETELWKRFW